MANKNKYNTEFGPDEKLPGYGLAGTVRRSMTSKGRAHLSAVTKEEVRRISARQAAEQAAPVPEVQDAATEATVEQPVTRKPRNRAANAAMVAANYAISGGRHEGPFDVDEKTRSLSPRARRIARRIGYAAAGAVGIAGISTLAAFGVQAASHSNAEHKRVHTEQQVELGKVVQPELMQIGDKVFTAYSEWHRAHPRDTAAYTETTLPDGDVEITANYSSNEVVMGTRSVDGRPEPDPSQTKYAYIETVGNGTIGDQYYLGAPGGSKYLPGAITTHPVGGGDYFAAASAPGMGGVMSLEDTTAYNDAIEGTDFSSPAELAGDIKTTYGLDDVVASWQQDPQRVNSNQNPDPES